MVNLTSYICKEARNDTSKVNGIIDTRVTNCQLQKSGNDIRPTLILEAALGVVGGLFLVSLLIIIVRLKKRKVIYRRMQSNETDNGQLLFDLLSYVNEYILRKCLVIFYSLEQFFPQIKKIEIYCKQFFECHIRFRNAWQSKYNLATYYVLRVRYEVMLLNFEVI